jgi:hypothetical protein
MANSGAVALARSILEAAGVAFFIKNDATQHLFALGQMGLGYNCIVGPPIIQVGETEVEKVRRLLKPLCDSGDAYYPPSR